VAFVALSTSLASAVKTKAPAAPSAKAKKPAADRNKSAEYQKAVRATKSLISYYTFDGETANDSVARNHGKVVGSGAKYTPGAVGKAICFTAKTALVEFGYVPAFAFKGGSGTVELLLNHSGHTGGTNYVFAQRSGWAPNSMRYGFCLPELTSMIVASRGSRANLARERLVVTQNQWHHLAVVYEDGKFVRAYFDGNRMNLSGQVPLVKAADKFTFHLGATNAKPDWECWSGRFDELAIYGAAIDEKTIVRHAKLAGCLRELVQKAPPKKPAPAPRSTVEFDTKPVRAAVQDLAVAFGDRYPKAGEYLKGLDGLDRLKEEAGSDASMLKELDTKFAVLRRKALISNPLLAEYPIVYILRPQYPHGGSHAIDTMYHTDEEDNLVSTGQYTPGGALKVIHFGKGGAAKTLVEQKEGMVREPDIHFDGKKILFSMRKTKNEDFHIWEMDADPKKVMKEGGANLRQLTSLKEASDIDPIYMPDDAIVFTSTRDRKYNMCSRDVAANLYRMQYDGANINQITMNTLYDNHAALMPDGRILYARWEYVDRNFGDAHGLWTVNPDGTAQAVYWANNTHSPGAVFNARVIPGTNKVLCIFGPHHNWLWGSMAIVNARLGMDVDAHNRKPIIKIWPANHINLIGRSGYDHFGMRTRPRYCDPYPLNDKYFLCSKETGRGVQMGLFLVDVFGNEIMLHSEGKSPWGCYDPMPLKPRKRPPVIPVRRDYKENNGLISIQDVYVGTHMKGVKRGSAKYLRVVEAPPKEGWSWGNWGGQGFQAPGMNWHDFTAKRILGAVPVEEDGSAYFEVPSDKFIFFQLLDESGMMMQSMRSGTILQSGEAVSCIGCHEDRLQAPPASRTATMAMKRKPSQLKDWYGPTRSFSYTREVQPVFDKHCVKCHDFDKDAGKTLVLAGDRNPYFNASYVSLSLWHKKRIRCVGGGPAAIQQAYSWGSHPSLLSKIIRPMSAEEVGKLNAREKLLRGKHKKVRISKEEMDRINTWLDLNGVYYPEYLTAYPGKYAEMNQLSGRCPLDVKQLGRLRALTGVNVGGLRHNSRRLGPQISFERPELSPCLARLKENTVPYKEALAIIRAGGEMLKKKPRCDMPGFVACERDLRRMDRYRWLRSVERQFRDAVRDGRKLYDKDIPAWNYEKKQPTDGPAKATN